MAKPKAKSKAWMAIAANSWNEDGWWWGEDARGQLYYLDEAQVWRRYPPLTFKTALKESIQSTASDFMNNMQYVGPLVAAFL